MDDFFGASRAGLKFSGGIVMDELCSLLGYPCDKRKSGDFLASMCVLGAQVTFDLSKTMVRTVVDETKAKNGEAS